MLKLQCVVNKLGFQIITIHLLLFDYVIPVIRFTP